MVVRGKFDFDEPVIVHLDGKSHEVSNVQHAASFLDRYWDNPENRRWEIAIRFCEAALFGAVTPEEVRSVFLQAIHEAGMFVANKGSPK